MITTEQLKSVFNEKLAETGSLDKAFTKATWVAYKQGIKDGSDISAGLEHLRNQIIALGGVE